MLVPTKLRVNDDPQPMGLDDAVPSFSWVPVSQERGQRQSAYQILVASAKELLSVEKADFWDSGRVDSGETLFISYAGKTLGAAREYWWILRIWDATGLPSPWSSPVCFGMGLFSPSDWKASWIGRGPEREPKLEFAKLDSAVAAEEVHGPIPVEEASALLRREFLVSRSLRRAVVFVCGLGFYYLYVNGRRTGRNVLTPSKTDYRELALYDAYDVTDLLHEGANALGLMLGNGWYNPLKEFWDWHMQWHGAKRAILQLHMEYSDETQEVLVSDDKWKTSIGPVQSHCIYGGEIYDARLEQSAWDMPHFDDAAWTKANLVEAPGKSLHFHAIDPIQVTEQIRPKSLWETEPNIWIFDMGQNFSGFVRLRIKGTRGTQIKLRYAENIYPNGSLDPRTNMNARNTDLYILKGEGEEVFEPSFTYHGFQYVEISGLPEAPTLDSVEGLVLHSNCRQAGEFKCSNDLINHIHHCTLWSQRSNMMGFPSDDNQRDERLGWMADGHLTAEEFMCNFDAVRFYRKWLEDMKHAQNRKTGALPHIVPRSRFIESLVSPAWSSAYPLVAWYLYGHTGDRRILEEHYEPIRHYVEFLGSIAKDFILPPDFYGDHLSLVGGWKRSDPPMTSSFYYYYDAKIVAYMSDILGFAADHVRYEELASSICKSFNRTFFDSKLHTYGGDTQCELILPLLAGMEPCGERRWLIERLVKDILETRGGHLCVGILGAKYVLDLLMEEARNDVLWKVVNQLDFPGWGYMTQGRTTLSEAWDRSGTNNHVMWGHIDTWFYRALAGIQSAPGFPGFKRVRIQPYMPGDLQWVCAAIHTLRGRVAVGWKQDGDSFSLDVTIPANLSAELRLPAANVRHKCITESGNLVWDEGFQPGTKGVISGEGDDTWISILISSGVYHFECGKNKMNQS